jgi:hypothetical protein
VTIGRSVETQALLEAPREVTAAWHIRQAKRLLETDAGRELDSVLVYVALELRTAVERCLFELIALAQERDLTDQDVRRARSMQGLGALLKEADSAARQTIQFTAIVASLTPGIPAVGEIDPGYLVRVWSELSEYCHFHAQPDKTWQSPERGFQRKGFTLVRQVLDKLLGWRERSSLGFIERSTMPAETQAIYDEFVSRRIDAEETRKRLLEAEPAIRARTSRSE